MFCQVLFSLLTKYPISAILPTLVVVHLNVKIGGMKYKLNCVTFNDFLWNIHWRRSDIQEYEIANDHLIHIWYSKIDGLLKAHFPRNIIAQNKKDYLKQYFKLPKFKHYRRDWMRKARAEQKRKYGCMLW